MDSNKQIWYEGELELNGFVINCYVLKDGSRLLSGREMQRAMKMVDEADDGKQTSGARLQRYLEQKSLQPFIFKDKEEGHFDPIECYRGNSKINGYEATILVDLCDAFLEARNSINLSQRQSIIANQCEVLMRSFAKVGIIALVDEATGYQYEREQDELQKIHKLFIAEELQPYVKQFPNEFYREIFRLNGWAYTVNQIKFGKRPGVIGAWTKKFIYGGLPNGVLEVLLDKTPRRSDGRLKNKLFQHLTKDEGIEALKKQLIVVTTMMNLSKNWNQFKRFWNEKFGQKALPFDDYELLEPKKNYDKLKDFNKSIVTALNHNPKEKEK